MSFQFSHQPHLEELLEKKIVFSEVKYQIPGGFVKTGTEILSWLNVLVSIAGWILDFDAIAGFYGSL